MFVVTTSRYISGPQDHAGLNDINTRERWLLKTQQFARVNAGFSLLPSAPLCLHLLIPLLAACVGPLCLPGAHFTLRGPYLATS